MYAEFYSQNPLLFWPLVGLAIFVLSFAAVLLYVFLGLRDRRRVEYLAALPLELDGKESDCQASDSQPVVESSDLDVAGGRA